MADDRLSAALEEARNVLGTWELTRSDDAPYLDREAVLAGQLRNVLAIADGLAAALGAALEHHQPRQLYAVAVSMAGTPLCGHDADYDGDAHFEDPNGGIWYCRDKPEQKVCITCTDSDDADLWTEWPCPTYAGITRELTGEANDGG